MKIILENFNYIGMHFNKYELDLPEVDDVTYEVFNKVITEKIKEDLDRRFWKEINSRT